MADEAFALSPISARAQLPSEADYDAIREAFMETARGRWFLGEYGKRNRNADTSMVLDAVARIEATIVAQKQVAPDPLPDTLVLIRRLLSDARASAANTMSGPDAEAALAAVNKGTRIIREIAWTLREYGTDTRICDMLDAQVNAIETSHQHTIAADKRDAVLATFDLLIRRIGELGGSGATPPWASAEAAPASSSSTDTDAPAGSVKTAEAATPFETAAEAEVAAATMADEIGTTARYTPPQETSTGETPAQEGLAHGTLTKDALTQDAPSHVSLGHEASARGDLTHADLMHEDLAQSQHVTAQANEALPRAPESAPAPEATAQAHDVSTQADDVSTLVAESPYTPQAVTQAREAAAQPNETLEAPQQAGETSAAAEMPLQAGIARAELTEADIIATADVQADLDLDTAQDLAVLDAVAQEMAEPEIANSAPAGAIVEPDTTASDDISFDMITASLVESAAVERNVVEPVVAGPFVSEPVLEQASATSIAPEQPPAIASPPSLGATLIASGIVSRSSAVNDALAPIRRMSQAERVAFFS